MEYSRLTRQYKEQPGSEVFAQFLYAEKRGETWEAAYEKLARLAKKENWNFDRPEYKRDRQNFPILVNYLNYTFLRAQDQDRISFSSDGSRACFNTRLQTRNEQDIFATFYKNHKNRDPEKRNQPDWTLYGFFDSYSEKLSDFRPLPVIASYYDRASDLVFERNYDIEINYDHLFDDNQDRLPEGLRDRTIAINLIRGAVAKLKDKIDRNYKLAIPHWYQNHMQLLLPLHLTSDIEADIAAVAEKDETSSLYRIKTVLTMDMAYMDARIITTPDSNWLNP